MHALTADLQALTRRGWSTHRDQNDDATWTALAWRGSREAQAVHEHQNTADAMVVAACLVADGHDLLRLLNQAYQALPEDATPLREEILQALMGTSVPPVSAGAGQPTGPARPEADAAALDTTASAGTGREAA